MPKEREPLTISNNDIEEMNNPDRFKYATKMSISEMVAQANAEEKALNSLYGKKEIHTPWKKGELELIAAELKKNRWKK